MRLPENCRLLRSLLNLFAPSVVLLGLFAAGVAADDDGTWRELFNGKTLEDWSATNFGGEGILDIDAGRIVLGSGSDLTGVTW